MFFIYFQILIDVKKTDSRHDYILAEQEFLADPVVQKNIAATGNPWRLTWGQARKLTDGGL